MKRRLRTAGMALVCAVFFNARGFAYVHIIKHGQTLADVAEFAYGDPKKESVLVGANALDLRGGSQVGPGMRIHVPAPTFTRAIKGDTWPALAQVWLGNAERSAVLSRANQMEPWVPPEEGREILVPAMISHIAGEGEDIFTIAKKYLGKEAHHPGALMIFNGRNGTEVKPGEIILVPLSDLTLTPLGKEEAKRSGLTIGAEGGGVSYQAQRRTENELPTLLADVRNGRYVDAITRGNTLLGLGDLSKNELTQIYKALTTAYVALDAIGAAAGACKAWIAQGGADLDPKWTSPKIRAVCTK
jgi:hypothetical protein